MADPAWNICVDTLQLRAEGWSDPPGSRWIRYARPRDCFKLASRTAVHIRSRPDQSPVLARFVLDSAVLPLVTDTLPIAEAVRRALMGIYGRLTERDGVRGASAVLSGKDEQGNPLADDVHSHAYYLPTDEDGDGRLDHLTIFARAGFGPLECRAIDGLRELRAGGTERHPLRVLLLSLGTRSGVAEGPFDLSRSWVSATPYLGTRHAKTRGRGRIDILSSQSCRQFLIADLRTQLAIAFPELAEASGIEIEPLLEGDAFKIARRWRPIQFARLRAKPGDDGSHRLSGAFRIRFASDVRGPIAFGHSAHFGMGLFMPESPE